MLRLGARSCINLTRQAVENSFATQSTGKQTSYGRMTCSVDSAANRPSIELHQPVPHRRWLPSRDLAVRLFLLGATGNAGRRILRFALERGHKMTAFVGDQKPPAMGALHLTGSPECQQFASHFLPNANC